MDNNKITVVTGLPRSGTSLMMKMLHRGGLPVFADNHKSYETDFAICLPHEQGWVSGCMGKAVKILDPHVYILPYEYDYRFIWMDRNSKEQAKSQIKLLKTLGFPIEKGSVGRMAKSIKRDKPKCISFLDQYGGNVLRVSFEQLINKPDSIAEKIAEFCGNLDAHLMARCVIKRPAKALPYMLEIDLIK